MTRRQDVKEHLCRAGHSIPGAAKKLGLGEGTLRRAIDRKEIQVVEFGGLKLITDAEIERVAKMLGIIDEITEEPA